MLNFLRQKNNIKKRNNLSLNTKALIFSIGAAVLVLIYHPKDLLAQIQPPSHTTSKPDDEDKKIAGLSLTAKELINGLPEEYKKAAYELVGGKKFNFTPAGTINSKADLDKITSDLSQAPIQNFSQITGVEKYSRENANKVIATLFNPSDSKIWLKKGFEKTQPTPDELTKYNKGITDAGSTYIEKLKIGGNWDKEVGEKKLDGKVFSDFETLFNYGISRISPQLQTREVYRRLFVASASLAEHKNALNKNDNNLPIVATQVSEYISLISPEQTSEKLYVKDGATYRLPSDYDINNLSKTLPLMSSFLGIGPKALAVLIQKNSSNILEDLSKLPTPPTSGLGGKKLGDAPTGNNGGNTGALLDGLLKTAGAGVGGVLAGGNNDSGNSQQNTNQEGTNSQNGTQNGGTTSGYKTTTNQTGSGQQTANTKTPSISQDIAKGATGVGTALGTGELLKLLTEKRKEQENKIKTAQSKIDELDAESQALVTERNKLTQQIANEESAIGRELYDFGNQCSTITPAAEYLKRDIRSNPSKIDNIPEGIGKIDVANSNIANTSSSIKGHYKTIIGYENRINEINSNIIANNNEITNQQKIISDAGVELAKLK